MMDPLEQEALDLLRKYRLLMPAQIKELLLKIAARLGWSTLEGELQ